MAHQIETMAYTNEVPWHGLGFRVDQATSVKAMLKAAKLDWRVDRTPMHLPNGDEVQGFAALTRSRDNRVLDVVGRAYVPVQNEEAFEFFTEFVEAGNATMETAGSLRGGQYVWGLANLKASFKLKGNDVVKGYLLVGVPHEQGKSFIIKFTSIRVVCNNTLALALAAGHTWRMTHRMSFGDVKRNEAKEALGIARDQLGEFERNARILQSINISRDDAVKILGGVFAPKKEDVSELPKILKIMDCYENAPGAQPGNGWGLLNGVTYYCDHVASRTADKRLANAWLGKTAVQKERVLDTLLQMGG